MTRVLGAFPLFLLFLALAFGARAQARFHSILNEEARVGFSSDLFLVGMEKDGRGDVGVALTGGEECSLGARCFNMTGASEGMPRIANSRLGDFRPIYVSHIVHLSTDGACQEIYSTYVPAGCGREVGEKSPSNQGAMQNSWGALEDKLYAAMSASYDERCIVDKRCPTHLIVMSTGWNNDQKSSLKRYSDWMLGVDSAIRAKGSPIVPMYVGISWPSNWAIPLASFLNKAHDADEAGGLWASVLLHRTFAKMRARYGVSYVAVGHSFGARLLASGVAGCPMVSNDCARIPPDGSPNVFIGLQAAFSTGRFSKHGIEGGPYSVAGQYNTRFVFTNSGNDRGVMAAPVQWVSMTTGYMGSLKGRRMALKDPAIFEGAYTLGGGCVQEQSAASEDGSGRVVMVDSTAYIDDHNDVFDYHTGQMIAGLISSGGRASKECGR